VNSLNLHLTMTMTMTIRGLGWRSG